MVNSRSSGSPCRPLPFLFLSTAVLLLALLWPTPAARAEAPPAAPDPFSEELDAAERLEALMARAREAQARIESLRATFTQRKESRLLLAPEESGGTFSYLAPDRALWEFLEPDRTTVLLTDEEMLTWYRDLGEAERLRGNSRTERLLEIIGAAQSLDRLRRYFDLTAAFPKAEDQPVRLSLEPRSGRVEKRVEEMEIHLDRAHYLPIYVRYVEAGGDVTELRFRDLEINAEVGEDLFVLDLPPEVEVRESSLGERNSGGP